MEESAYNDFSYADSKKLFKSILFKIFIRKWQDVPVANYNLLDNFNCISAWNQVVSYLEI